MISSITKPERKYIGSAVNIQYRISVHMNGLKNNKHHSRLMQRHFNKYGIEDLRFEVLEKVHDTKLLLRAEQSFLNMFQPVWNTCKVAGSQLGVKFGPLSDSHKKKISRGNRGKVVPEHVAIKFRVPIKKYDLFGNLIAVYPSSVHAAKAEGIRIRNSKGANITIGGFVWVSDTHPLPNFDLLRHRLATAKKALNKRVIQINKSGVIVAEFDGVREAYRKTGIDHRSISQVAAGSSIRKSAGGYYWKYKTEAA